MEGSVHFVAVVVDGIEFVEVLEGVALNHIADGEFVDVEGGFEKFLFHI